MIVKSVVLWRLNLKNPVLVTDNNRVISWLVANTITVCIEDMVMEKWIWDSKVEWQS